MDTTCAEILAADTLYLDNTWNQITNTVGLQYFKNVTYLDVSVNSLVTLDSHYLPPHLETLICGRQMNASAGGGNLDGLPMGGSLANIISLPSSLRYLDMSSSSPAIWPTWPPNLEYLNISGCKLQALPLLPATLKMLDCSKQAKYVYHMGDHAFPTLDTIISLPPNLIQLNCSYTSLTSLPMLPASLKYLDCSNTNFNIRYCSTGQCVPYVYESNHGIKGLPNWPAGLEYLNVAEGNNFMYVEDSRAFILPAIVPASIIDLTADSITTNIILPAGLKYLKTGSQTTCLPYLPASLGSGQSPYRTTAINLDLTGSSNVKCIPNTVPNMQTTPAKPYCNVLNNTNNCASDPSITGYAFYDLNSNGIWDANENPRSGVKVTNDNGVIGFTGINGQYATQGHIGNNVSSITPPVFYNAVPATINHTLNSADTLVTDTIALQPNVVADSMRITITPMGPARRGWDIPYNIKYENVGTTTVNANIVINYNNALLTPVGGPLSIALNNIAPGDRGEFTTSFYLDLNTAFGTEVHTTATITAGTSTCIDHSYLYVIFSLDPNDKHATPTLTAEQVSSGNYIDYLVRFQNVGNDTAFNINITDKLDAGLIANTLEFIEASHACTTTQINDYVNFKFSNILLPDSNVNEPASHGYVRFRIKPQQGLSNNTNLPNSAAIYFDFNSPVITNDAITIVNFAPVPLTLLDFNGMVQPNNNVLLSWKTANEISTSRFNIEQSNDGRKFSSIGAVTAKGTGDNNYSQQVSLPGGIVYYRLKIIDIDARYSYSNIIKISGEKNKAGFVLLNNPVRNEININLRDNNLANTNASIINSQGMIVKTFMLSGGMQHINVSTLAPGLYFIRTKNGTEKIIITR